MADYKQADIIVDAVIEWYAQRWTKSMIKAELRRWFKDPDITLRAMEGIMTEAKLKIQELYGIDAQEYKGRQIAFYELIIRKGKKTRDRLTAAERLDKLFGLENVQGGDPTEQARIIREQIRMMEDTMGVKPEEETDGDINDEGDMSGNETKASTEKPNLDPKTGITGDELSEEMKEIMKTVKDDELKEFENRKRDKDDL